MGVIFTLVVFIFLYSKISTLTREVQMLKKQTGMLPQNLAQQPVTNFAPASVASPVDSMQGYVPEQTMGGTQFIPSQSEYVPPQESAFGKWIKEDFFVKLGALLLLIGFGWFVSYAFIQDWIGPMGRISLGLVVGIFIVAFGTYRIRTFIHQGSIFIVLGSTVVLLTVFAAREVYDFFTPATALAVMFLTVVFSAFVSVRYTNKSLAFATLCLAGIAPFLTHSSNPDFVALFSYLLVVILGTLWVVRITAASELTFAALVLAFFYGSPFLLSGVSSGDKDIALLFAFVFTAIFFISNVIGLVYSKDDSLKNPHLAVAFGTGLYLISWIYTAAVPEFQSLLYAAWMLVFGLGTFVVYRLSANRIPFYIYSTISIALLGAATAAELQGPSLTIALTIEIGCIVALAYSLLPSVSGVRNINWLFLLPVLLSLQSIASSAWQTGFVHGDFFVLLTLALTLLAVSCTLFLKAERNGEAALQEAHALAITGAAYIFIIIWLALHSVLDTDVATMLSLCIFAIIGVALFITGKLRSENNMRLTGGVLLGFVVVHLLFIDVWQMELAGKIITFFAIGTLLVSTAFIKRSNTSMHQ